MENTPNQGDMEEKRGACRGESLIICLPIPTTTSHFHSTKKPLHRRVEGKKSGVEMEQMRRMVRSVEMVRMSG